jgi:osmotically inducible protein OsmC
VRVLFELLGFLLEGASKSKTSACGLRKRIGVSQTRRPPLIAPQRGPIQESTIKESQIFSNQFAGGDARARVRLQWQGDFISTNIQENVMQRKASAVWKGGLKDGKGSLSAPGGVLNNTQYSFSTRFENAPGTNPEELIAAAHAGCFSMALSAQLGGANLTPESISTNVTLTMEKLDSGWTITASHLEVVGKVPGADAATFQKYAEAAEKGCPVSKVLNAKITMNAKLE